MRKPLACPGGTPCPDMAGEPVLTLPPTGPTTLLTADVHLQTEADHPVNQAFMAFLEQIRGRVERLYILGDLFERWLGDDIGLAEYAPAIEALAQCVRAGTTIRLLYGNRDFLMREAFWDHTGIEPLPEVKLTRLYDQPVLLCHGDELCTRDRDYQRMRSRLRQRWVQWLILKMPPARRHRLGDRLRQQSREATATKPPEWMQVDEDTVRSWLTAYPTVQHMIHGHTHHPGCCRYPGDRRRWTLGDWSAQGAWLLQARPDRPLQLVFYSPDAAA